MLFLLLLSQNMEPINAHVEHVTFQGKKAIRVTEAEKPSHPGMDVAMVILKDVTFLNGEIELDMAGEPGPKASAAARGFVGLAFRVLAPLKFECIFLRPTNGRADDQIRRNHSLQYESIPDFPWFRMRKEFPEKYESYADLVPGVWTHYRLVVQDQKARVFVNRQPQPSLIVNDLRIAEKGGIALWIGSGTVAHFTEPRIKATQSPQISPVHP